MGLVVGINDGIFMLLLLSSRLVLPANLDRVFRVEKFSSASSLRVKTIFSAVVVKFQFLVFGKKGNVQLDADGTAMFNMRPKTNCIHKHTQKNSLTAVCI